MIERNMPPHSPKAPMNTGDTDLPHAPNHTKTAASKRGISDAALRAAKPEDKPRKIAIEHGLYLEVMPGGSKLWRLKYRIDGKENRYALGSYPDLSLKEAREESTAARKLVKQGINPAKQKQLDRIKSGHEQKNTLEAIANEWLALKDWEEVTKKRRLDMLKRVVFPTIGQLPVKQITPPIILNILKIAAEKNGPSVMAEAKRTLYGIFELATETFRVDSNPVHQWREALPKNKTQHKRALSIKEIGQLLNDVDGHGGSYQIQCA